ITKKIDTYTRADGTVGVRTNSFTYAANDLDLVLHVGPAGEQVVSNYFNNAYHQPDASYDALNQATLFTYNASRQLTKIVRPSGLTTTNIYLSGGSNPGRLDKTIDIEIARTNSYTYSNGLIASHTDERGLTTTSYWDSLQRLVGVAYPNGTISNRFTLLDLASTKDRLGQWTYFGYNAIRQ